MSRGERLPVIIGKGRRKGCFGFRSRIFGGKGYNLAIVRLSRDYQSGDPIALQDMEGAEVILHFCDRQSVQITADTLNRILRNWPEGEE